MSRLIELPTWFLAALVVTAGAIGGGASLAIDHLITRGRR